ncbi:MAG: hypothetical protein R6V10_07165 [bacterium]
MKRRVQSDQVVHALPAPQARQAGVSPNQVKKKPPKTPKEPRIKELLLQARRWRHLLDTGQVPSQAAIARLEGITRGRITQIMSLRKITPPNNPAPDTGDAQIRQTASYHRTGTPAHHSD